MKHLVLLLKGCDQIENKQPSTTGFISTFYSLVIDLFFKHKSYERRFSSKEMQHKLKLSLENKFIFKHKTD